MRKSIAVLSTVLMLNCCNLTALAEETTNYNEGEEAGKRVINNIEQASNLVNGDWDAIEISGLYIRLYDSVVEMVEAEGEIKGYQIVEINYSGDGKYFSIKVKPTVYHVKKGDTLTKIAKEKDLTVDKLLEMNSEITNPNLIYEGDTLKF